MGTLVLSKDLRLKQDFAIVHTSLLNCFMCSIEYEGAMGRKESRHNVCYKKAYEEWRDSPRVA